MSNPIQLTLPHRFRPRPYQLPLFAELDRGKKRAVCVWARGLGKDLCALNYLLKRAIMQKGVYLHCFPNFTQGKRAIWTSVHQTDDGDAMAYLDHIPSQLIKSKNSSEMMIQLVNGSIYCVMGLDGKNATRARGMNPNFVILSEYAYMDPEAWHTLEPRVSQNNGCAIFLSTPNGQNHFYQLFNHAKVNPETYYSSLLTIEDAKTLPSNFIEDKRAEGIPEDFILQEYFCSFTRGAEGSYYGKQIQRLRDDKRICPLPILVDLPVYTSWDIGLGDSTAIWFFQILRNGEVNFVNYYENHGEGLEHYIAYVKEWQNKKRCVFAHHFVPFDMQNREFTSGVDRLTSAREFGIEMTVVPKKPIMEGIQAVRSTIPISYFDPIHCARGIKCLDFYCKKYNDILKTYSDDPLHNQWSHGADAMRYAVIGIRAFTQTSVSVEKDFEAVRKYWGA